MTNFLKKAFNDMIEGAKAQHEVTKAEFKTLNDFKKAIEEYIQWYNLERINVKRKGLSPFEYRQQSLSQL